MGYCDSAQLEKAWFNWIIANSVPILEPYRISNCLLTKITGLVYTENGKELLNPFHPVREHIICIGKGVHCTTDNGKITEQYIKSVNGLKKSTKLPLEYNTSSQHRNIGFDVFPIETKRELLSDGWIEEVPRKISNDLMLADIINMCNGISKVWNGIKEDLREDLSQDALAQVIKKINDGKLVYKPGKAPVFNLLTTTIRRCMLSYLNKINKQTQHRNKLIEDVASGVVNHPNRSVKSPIPKKYRNTLNN
jgi:hypothetical protein